jgi:hypothetical protein
MPLSASPPRESSSGCTIAEAAMKYTLPALVLVFTIGAAGWADDLKTLDDKKINGTLEKITDSKITLKSDGQSVETALDRVLELTLRPVGAPSATRYIEVQLVDESIVRCTKVSFTAKEARLELTTGVTVKAPISALLTVLRDADDPAVRKQWKTAMNEKVRKDRIFTLSNGQLQPIDGIIGAIDEKKQTLKFNAGKDIGEIEPALDKLQGLQFARTDPLEKTRLCTVIDVEGNRIVAHKVGFDGAKLTVTTPFGEEVAVDPKLVAVIDFNLGRLTYLSDLDEKLTESGLLGGFNPLRKNTNLDGRDIILQDKKYAKGLSMYAGVEVEYNLGGTYKEFKAILGVDSAIADEGQGQVTVTVYCDGEKRSAFEVSVKAPTPIAVNVKDVKTLKIVVTGANFTGYSGHATLANAHVSQ